jgi:hypothetical protein
MATLNEDTISEARRLAIDAVVRAMRTGEYSAANVATKYLAPDVTMNANGIEVTTREGVIDRITGQWPFTPVLAHGEWSLPEELPDAVKITAEFPGLGASPSDYALMFRFDQRDLITRIEERFSFKMTAEALSHIPAHVRTAINRALANQTPMVLAYVDNDGAPSLSLRGSVQVYSSTQLCLWVRNSKSGLIRAIHANRPLSMLYRNSTSRTTLTIRGRGRVIEDPLVRRRIFDLSPEVEQHHDVAMTGAAVIIDVSRIHGTSPKGPVLFVID